jgi:hypothetical protein
MLRARVNPPLVDFIDPDSDDLRTDVSSAFLRDEKMPWDYASACLRLDNSGLLRGTRLTRARQRRVRVLYALPPLMAGEMRRRLRRVSVGPASKRTALAEIAWLMNPRHQARQNDPGE